MKSTFWAAGALGLCTGATLYAYTAALRREAQGGAKTGVLVALQDADAEAKLERAHVGIRAIPAGFVHPDTVLESEAERVLGRVLAVPLVAGQPLLWRDLRSTAPARRPLADIVPRGLRALTLPVDVASSLGGALRAGDRVDLLGTFARASEADRATVTLLQNVPVLAAAEPSADRGTQLDHVTVALTLEEAELVAFALGRGHVQVVLRHKQDHAVLSRVPEKTFADIFEVERRAALGGRRAIEQLRGAEP